MSALADLLAIPEADGPDEPWFIEPKDRLAASEETRQRTFLAMLSKTAPRVIVWAVPNAAKRTKWAAGKAKREGMRKGALDLTLTWSNGIGENAIPGSAYIEFKNGKEPPTPEQRALLNQLYRQRHHCGVFRTADCAITFLKRAGAPFIDRQWL